MLFIGGFGYFINTVIDRDILLPCAVSFAKKPCNAHLLMCYVCNTLYFCVLHINKYVFYTFCLYYIKLQHITVYYKSKNYLLGFGDNEFPLLSCSANRFAFAKAVANNSLSDCGEQRTTLPLLSSS